MNTLLQFGAGRIGRSFIARLFNQADYRIIFADIDPCLVRSLNEEGKYNIIIKETGRNDEVIVVDNLKAIDIESSTEVVKAIADSRIISLSVGKKSMLNLAEILSRGIKKRYEADPDNPIDIILAENVRNGARLLSKEISKYLNGIPLDEYVGFVETSIGKMVPLMTTDQVQQDPLAIFAESYNELILDANGFRGKLPDIPDLYPKQNMKAWVDRKIFIHNLGHAVLAYRCNWKYPNIVYTWEALQLADLLESTRNTMLQSAAILAKLYPEEFNDAELEKHVDDLLRRFANKALGDTIFRVGCDLGRKLANDDRLMIPVKTAMRLDIDMDLILEAWTLGCSFSAKDERGKDYVEDKKFRTKYGRDPLRILEEHCGFDPEEDRLLFKKVQELISKVDH